jgi:hypothetical protein
MDKTNAKTACPIPIADDGFLDIRLYIREIQSNDVTNLKAGGNLSGNDTNDACRTGSTDFQVIHIRKPAMECCPEWCWRRVRKIPDLHSSLKHPPNRKEIRVFKDDEISQSSWCQCTTVMETKSLCRGEGCHPESDFKLHPRFNGNPYTIINGTLNIQHIGMAVICGECAAGGSTAVCKWCKIPEIACSCALSHEYIHPLPELIPRLITGNTLMITLNPGSDIPIKKSSREHRGMAVNNSTEAKLGKDIRIIIQNTRYIHHLPKTDNAWVTKERR